MMRPYTILVRELGEENFRACIPSLNVFGIGTTEDEAVADAHAEVAKRFPGARPHVRFSRVGWIPEKEPEPDA